MWKPGDRFRLVGEATVFELTQPGRRVGRPSHANRDAGSGWYFWAPSRDGRRKERWMSAADLTLALTDGRIERVD